MNSPLFVLGVGALALALMIGSGRSVVAGTELPSNVNAGEGVSIRVVQRSARGLAEMPARDPFASETQLPAVASDTAAELPAVQLRPPAPVFPDFRILGKQQDEDGWAVYIGEPGKSGQVWVVRQGETFNERFMVSKLTPPVLVIKSLRGRQSRTFDIGKDEDIE